MHDGGATSVLHNDNSTSTAVSISLQGASGPLRGTSAEADAELEALRNERALLIDKLNNHPDVRKYAGAQSVWLAQAYIYVQAVHQCSDLIRVHQY